MLTRFMILPQFATCILIAISVTPQPSAAEVRLPRLLTDGVVLQRDTKVTVGGWADVGESVDVSLDGEPVGNHPGGDGRWFLDLPAQPAGGPHVLEFAGENRVSVHDVYFGDVWLASGQSNMQLPMERVREKFDADIAAADLPLIRFFTGPREYDFNAPRTDLDGGQWLAATPESIMELSAAGFFFARDLYEAYGVPIGLVNVNYGGSAAESWMSEAALEAYPHYLDVAKRYRDGEYLQSLLDADAATTERWQAALDAADAGLNDTSPWHSPGHDDADWLTMNVPGNWADTPVGPVHGAVWFRREFELPAALAGQPGKLMLGRIVDADTTWVNGHPVGNVTYQYPPRRYEVDAGILQAGRNVIAIRVVSNGGTGGFVEDKPYWLRVGDTVIDLTGPWRLRLGAEAPVLSAPRFVWYKQPLSFYNAMLAPLLPMTIKGVIWYQGESNTDRPQEYRNLFRAMIRNWRADFGQGDFPFLFVQLANFMESFTQPTESEWAETREAQRLALAEPNTAMAVIIDAGEWNDLHPLDKKTVGERLALAARFVAYGDEDV
ncbi:MAG: beta galactosidase jelly roll domain-containing protein, partial [Planctomycetes bacterium]|nr:beta galactosidase jelly roll domain-containing protein [Planctomycetota bacterium]